MIRQAEHYFERVTDPRYGGRIHRTGEPRHVHRQRCNERSVRRHAVMVQNATHEHH